MSPPVLHVRCLIVGANFEGMGTSVDSNEGRSETSLFDRRSMSLHPAVPRRVALRWRAVKTGKAGKNGCCDNGAPKPGGS